MYHLSLEMGKNCEKKENSLQHATESLESKGESLEPDRCQSKLDPHHTLIPNVRRSRASSSLELFVPNSIPKHITTLDEKYVLRCLELIRNCALKAADQNFDILPYDLSNLIKIGGSYNTASASGDWTIGPVTGSQSMINILKSPLLQQYGSIDLDVDFEKTSLSEGHEPQKDVTPVLDRNNYVSTPPMHERVVSISSTNSSFFDMPSSSSLSAATFQGMLQCTWKDGVPHHVFTVDDKREVYVSNVSKKVNFSGDKSTMEYIYNFHSRQRGKKEYYNDIHELDLESVAKMRVSTSITTGSDDSEIRETSFVLSVSNDDTSTELQISNNHTLRKNKRLTRKVVDVLRSSYKQRSRFGGSSVIFEEIQWDPSQDMNSGPNPEKNYVPNLEMAVIIVKDVFKNREEEADIGGWGLKFLKKSRNDECKSSTSMDVIIPAGVHGGPKTRVGGPSSLAERWVSGGSCDCGGWDIGCPLTILKTRSSCSLDSSSHMDSSVECESVDFFMQGSKQEVPMLKMVNIHEGLYYIHFQSTLSTLQSFAIAAALIHSRSPVLRSKVYRT